MVMVGTALSIQGVWNYNSVPRPLFVHNVSQAVDVCNDMMLQPYDQLTPAVIADALSSVGLETDGRMMPLGSYENRVYQVYLEDCIANSSYNNLQVVVKFYRPGRWSRDQIAEEHRFALELAQAEIPVVAPEIIGGSTIHEYQGFLFAVYQRMGGRPPEQDDPQVLEWIGRFLGRIHLIGRREGFRVRPQLNIQTFGYEVRDWLVAHEVLPLEVRANWLACCDEALQCIEQIWATLPDLSLLRLHGDCHPGNILWRPEHNDDPGGPHFVDLDDARMGPAVQDIWMLLSGEPQERGQQLACIMAGYEDFCAFDWRELVLVEPLRTLRMIHYSAWLAKRWDDPAFPLAFPWFGTAGYWEEQVRSLQTQTAQMRDVLDGQAR